MGPVLPPRRRRLRSLLLPLATAGALAGGVGYVVHVWPAPEPFVVPRDRHPVALVPMTTDAAYLTGTGGTCLSLLDDYLRRPNWTLTLEAGTSGCTGDSTRDTITLDADGDASWSGGGLLPRPLHLTPTQIAALHAAAALSCERPASEDGSYGYSSSFVVVHWGGRDAPERRVGESPAQAALDAFIDDAVMHYRDRRLAERASFRATFDVAPYQVMGVDRPMKVTIDGRGKLTIRVARRTITAEDLDLATLVDAIDWVEQGGPRSDAMLMPFELRMALDRATYMAGVQR
ncbi:MAG TPA: hypothetical protein VM261_15520 [Kofleriaceae bacterium]|nr:hypothetical protein [Kofleriaceae bacterium]